MELHNRDLHLFTLLLWPHSSEASLEGSHSTQSANCLRAPSASTQRASATLSRAMKRREEQDRGNVGEKIVSRGAMKKEKAKKLGSEMKGRREDDGPFPNDRVKGKAAF